MLQDGDVQLWGLAGGHVKLLDSVPCGDSVTAVACFSREPYVLLGCESGCIQLLGFTNSSGGVVEGVGAVTSTSLLPYECEWDPCFETATLTMIPFNGISLEHRL